MKRFAFICLSILVLSCREAPRTSAVQAIISLPQKSNDLDPIRFQWPGSFFSRCLPLAGKGVLQTLRFQDEKAVEWIQAGMSDESCRTRDASEILTERGSYEKADAMEGQLIFPEGSALQGATYRLGRLSLKITFPQERSQDPLSLLYKGNETP